MADESKEELKRKKKETKQQIKDMKKQQKQQRNEIRQIKEENGIGHTSTILTVALVFIFILIILALIKFDVGGFGSKVLAPIIGDVPYINRILPEGSAREELDFTDSEKKKNTTTQEETTEMTTEATTAVRQSTTQKKTEAKTDTNEETSGEDDNSAQEDSTKKNASGKKSASESTANPNLDPTMQNYVETYSNMEASSAAQILEGMAGDYHLVAEILYNMDAEKRAAILAAMSPNNVAKIMKIMEKM